MKRLEIVSPKAPLKIAHYKEIPKPPPKGAVIKTTFSGICHTDIHLWDDEMSTGGKGVMRLSSIPTYHFPIVPGHEIAGVVHSLGAENVKGADELKVGDPVILYSWIGCGECSYCAAGESQLCKKITDSLGVGTDGGYAEYVVVRNKEYVIKLPNNIPMHIASMLPCSGLTTFNAVSKIKPIVDSVTKIKGKATLLIIGAGGLGMWCIQNAKALLPKTTKIISADVTKEKLDNAILHGADDTVLWDLSFSHEKIVAHTKAKGFDGGIDAIIDLVNSGDTSPKAFESMNKGGVMAVVGLFGGALSLPLPTCALQVSTIKGVYVGSLHQLRDLVQLFNTAKLMPPDTMFCTLEEAPDILNRLRDGKIKGRAIIKFT